MKLIKIFKKIKFKKKKKKTEQKKFFFCTYIFSGTSNRPIFFLKDGSKIDVNLSWAQRLL